MSAPIGLERHRPKTIVIVAVFLFAATILALMIGESLLFPNTLLDYLWKFNTEGAVLFHSLGRASGAFLLALGAGTFFAALGLLRGRRWAWWFGIFLFSVDACGNVVSYFIGHDALRSGTGMIVSATFLFFLCRYPVRSYFFFPALTPNHKP